MPPSLPFLLYVDSYLISPYVFSAFVGLREKGIPFDMIPINLQKQEQFEPSYRALSLTSRVPALVEQQEHFCITESSAILEYLEESFPSPQYTALFPKDQKQRARCRQILSWLRSDFVSLREHRPTTTIFYQHNTGNLSEAAQAEVNKLLHATSTWLENDSLSLFSTWSIADSDLAFMWQRLLLNGYEAPSFVHRFVENQWNRPSIQEFITNKRPPYDPR